MSEAALNVAVILGSTRPNRRSEPVARYDAFVFVTPEFNRPGNAGAE